MDRDTFLNESSWLGSYYELCLEIGASGDDQRLNSAVANLWAQPQLHGGWADRASYPQPPTALGFADGFVQPRYGAFTLSSGHRLGCVTHTVRETDGSDWLDLCFPTGMLQLLFDVRHPLEYATNPWMRTVDRDLAQVAASMFRTDPYLLGLIGEEVSGLTNAESINAETRRCGPFLLPDSLWLSLGLNCRHHLVAPGLIAVGLKENGDPA